MLFTLHFFHFVGNSVFLTVFLLVGVSGVLPGFSHQLLSELIFFVAIPALLVSIGSGILLVVERNYVVRQQPWLRQKGILTILVLLILILMVLPASKALIHPTGETRFPAFLYAGIWLVWLLYIILVGISLQHRITSE